MPTNKNAILRYLILDKCFQNFGRKYYFNDLLEEVNIALTEDNMHSSGIQTRQLRDDIRFMKSEIGYSAPIIMYREGKKGYYRYEDPTYSINNSPLNKTEAEQLKNAISILKRFEGSPQFEWINELSSLLNDQFGLKDDSKKVMGYDANVDYSGYQHITSIFNAIVNKQVLSIDYKPFKKKAFKLTFHPYYLKQYNNRWFVFGRNEEIDQNQWNIALDRIKAINLHEAKYKEDKTDWEEFFYDIIGVSKPKDYQVEQVELLFNADQAPYIKTKPIHPSQKSEIQMDGSLLVRLQIIINYELETKILSYGDRVKVQNPNKLIDKITRRLNEAKQQYE